MLASVLASARSEGASVLRAIPGDLQSATAGEALDRLRGFYARARGGVLYIAELEALFADIFAVPLLETLRELVDSDPSVTVVLCGDPDSVGNLQALNPDLYTRFHHAAARSFTIAELAQLLVSAVERRGISTAPGFLEEVQPLIRRVRATGNLLNSRIVEALAAGALRAALDGRVPQTGLRPENIDTTNLRLVSLTEGDGFTELDSLIGLSDVKSTVRLWLANSQLALRREQLGLHTAGMGQHMVFKGPAGTAKTTVARIMGRILAETGVLSSGHLVEVQRADIIAEVPEQTARRMVEVVKRSLGGVLFIDEAYTLTSTDADRLSTRDSGREAVDTLLKLMEDYREEFVVVVAGYPLEMEQFLNSNPGLRSRFARVMEFPSYSSQELLDIMEFLASQRGYVVDNDVRSALTPRLGLVSKYPGFGNGRHVRNLLESAIVRQGFRLDVGCSDDELRTLTVDDFADPTAISSVS
jgi:Holliday junction resolvasome RuvABC ATP-dependent DNA helicase subunit